MGKPSRLISQGGANNITTLPPLPNVTKGAGESQVQPTADLPKTPFERYCVRTGYIPGERRVIPLHLIDRDPYSGRHFYVETNLRVIRDSLGEPEPGGQVPAGQREPIYLRINPDDENRFFCWDGNTRRETAGGKGATGIEAVITDLPNDPAVILRSSVRTFTERSDVTDMDRGFSCVAALKAGVDRQELMDIYQCSNTQLTRYLAYGELSGSVVDEMRPAPGKFPSNVAYRLKEVGGKYGETTAAEMARVIRTSAFTIRQLAKACELLDAGFSLATAMDTARGTRAASGKVTLPVVVAGREAGVVKVAGNRLSVELADPEIGDAQGELIRQAIQAVLDGHEDMLALLSRGRETA